MAEEPSPPRIFVDSSVLFAAAASSSGASRALVLLAEIGLLRFVVSQQIFEEVERNLADTAPKALPFFVRLRQVLDWEVVDYPAPILVAEAAKHIALKDAPILAAAMSALVARLITLDKRHFKTEAVLNYSQLMIQTPSELIQDIRQVLSAGISSSRGLGVADESESQ
jgi:predicted nucleic acid-binding protein